MRSLLYCAILSGTIALGCSSNHKGTPTSAVATPPRAMPTVEGNIQTTQSSLQYIDKRVGDGVSPNAGQRVTVRSVGWLTNGNPLVGGAETTDKPYTFTLGGGQAFKGYDEGVASMKVGGERRLIIPPELAAGPDGIHDAQNFVILVPPNATLIFDVTLVSVE